jgi:hypothetical protein
MPVLALGMLASAAMLEQFSGLSRAARGETLGSGPGTAPRPADLARSVIPSVVTTVVTTVATLATLSVASVSVAGCARETPRSEPHVIDETESVPRAVTPVLPPSAAPTNEPEARPEFVDLVMTDDGTVKSITRRSVPCPWLEYAPAWKSLRFRSDREGCSAPNLSDDPKLVRTMLDFAVIELGSELEPTSFGLSDYPEMYERIAPRVLADKTWDAKAGKVKHGSLHTLVVSLANDPPAFIEVQQLFEGTGFTPSLASVEKVFVGPISETTFSQALIAKGTNATLKVPYGSIVGFSLAETEPEPEP